MGERSAAYGRAAKFSPRLQDQPIWGQYVTAVLAVAMKRQGLTPTWARPELNTLLAEDRGDGRVRDAETDTEPGE